MCIGKVKKRSTLLIENVIFIILIGYHRKFQVPKHYNLYSLFVYLVSDRNFTNDVDIVSVIGCANVATKSEVTISVIIFNLPSALPTTRDSMR